MNANHTSMRTSGSSVLVDLAADVLMITCAGAFSVVILGASLWASNRLTHPYPGNLQDYHRFLLRDINPNDDFVSTFLSHLPPHKAEYIINNSTWFANKFAQASIELDIVETPYAFLDRNSYTDIEYLAITRIQPEAFREILSVLPYTEAKLTRLAAFFESVRNEGGHLLHSNLMDYGSLDTVPVMMYQLSLSDYIVAHTCWGCNFGFYNPGEVVRVLSYFMAQ